MSARDIAAAYLRRGWQPVPIPAGRKGPVAAGWPDRPWRPEDFAAGDNVGVILGSRSGGLVDVDLDCPEAIALADLYLPATGAVFGRPTKPRSHWLYVAPGAVKESWADPSTGETLLELRADGRDGAAHQTLFPPSVASGEARRWAASGRPVVVDATELRRRCALLAIGCLIHRHVSETAARDPGDDFPALLYEADPALGRPAFRWLGLPDPEAPQYRAKRREDLTGAEATLWELAEAIPNDNLAWDQWNAFGLAFFAASGGSEEGFLAFDRFSAKCAKYNGPETAARWRNYRRSPPNNSGVGKLIVAARAAGWRSKSEAA